MTSTHHRSIAALLGATLLCTSACKDDKVLVQDETPASAEAPTSSPEGNEAIYAAMGCPADQLTATGCKVCLSPEGEVWREEGAGSTGEVTLTVRRGRYSEYQGPQALVSYAHCIPTSHNEQAEALVYLEQDEETKAWTPKATTLIPFESEIKECVEFAHRGKNLTHLLCHADGGRRAPNQQAISIVSLNKLSSSEPPRLPSPESIPVSSTEDVEDCSKNFMLKATPKPELKDVNGDGELDVVVHVELEESPWMGDRSESACPGEAPLKPAREVVKKSYDLVFEAQPDGSYKETSGNPVDIAERSEYAEFF